MQKIIVAGDLHCDWGPLNQLINKKKPDVILQCGDFGWWPHYHNGQFPGESKIFDQHGIKPQDTKIYWCDGNHENHEDLAIRIENNDLECAGKNIFYMPRGTVLQLEDGRNVLFFGGAYSVDKHARVEGESWWRGEIPTHADFLRMEQNTEGKKIDIVISHTAPKVFADIVGKDFIYKAKDPTVQFLDHILERFKPARWVFGHYHRFLEGRTGGCKWTALSHTRYNTWWVPL